MIKPKLDSHLSCTKNRPISQKPTGSPHQESGLILRETDTDLRAKKRLYRDHLRLHLEANSPPSER